MSSSRLLWLPLTALLACAAAESHSAPDAGLTQPSDAGPAVPCYAYSACGGGRCTRKLLLPLTFQRSDPEDLAWAPADVVAAYATLYNSHVDLRVRFRATPFDPTRHQTLRLCLDTDADASTGTACGTGALAGADTAFTYEDGELVEKGPLGDPCSVGGFDAATKTVRFDFERDTFPVGYLGQQFRYVIISSTVSDAGETITDTVPDEPDFSRADGALTSEHSFTLWSPAGSCCRFREGSCVGGACVAP